MTTRVYRWAKRLMFLVAALPVLQATGTCDPGTLISAGLTQFGNSTFNLLVGSTTQVLLQNFPSADLLQILLGGNPRPFFTGAG